MTANPLTPYQLFKRSFTIKYLRDIFQSNIECQRTKGLDRINAYQFSLQSTKHLKIIKYKCLKSSYQFSPYMEMLKAKGRDKNPRLIAIPTVRDRIVLYALKEILSNIFKDCVPRKLAKTYIYDIIKFSENKNYGDLGIFRTDIKNFYDSIDRKILMKKLETRIKSKKILILIERAISSPIVPKHYRKNHIHQYRTSKGIPQGLSISNILAAIYVSEHIDKHMQENYQCTYLRYVDDMLIFSDKNQLTEVKEAMGVRFSQLKLEINQDKTFCDTSEKPFEYLGYYFKLPKVTIKQSALDNFLHSIAVKFSNYIHSKQAKLKEINEDKIKAIFIDELNEKITGAISGNKFYGWIFYFNAINDLTVLYKIDDVIFNFFKRLDDFNRIPPHNLKKIAKAYYQSKYNVNGGYIHDYNRYQNIYEKTNFLSNRGWLSENKQYSEQEINKLYTKARSHYLSQLEKDDANIY